MVKRDASEAVKHNFCGTIRCWASFINPNVLALSIGLLFAQPAFAEHINWADWTTSETGDPGSASGDVCGVDIQYSGNLVFAASGYWTEGSPPPYTGNSVVSNAPTGAVLASDLAGSRTITFSREVQDPIIAILSLGRPYQPVSYSFNAPFTVLSEGSGAYGDGWYTGALTGYEFHGVIQFSGKFTSIQWGSSPGENWHGVTVGIPDSKCCGLKEIQQTPPDSNGNITVSAVTENQSNASVYWKIEPDTTKGNTDIICADISPEQGITATITSRPGTVCDMLVTALTSESCKKEAHIRVGGCEECKGGGDCKAAGSGGADL